ncbi:nitroreductase family protein [Chloroflexota bacterium]
MLNVWETIKMRRSIRKFTPDDVPDEMIQQMLEAARLAPSAGNVQPWRFLVIRDPEVKQKLRQICLDQRFIEEVPVVIICFGDLTRYSSDSTKKRQQEFIDSGVQETLSGLFADPEFRTRMDSMPTPPREKLIAPVIANTYIAIEHLVIMATALGLGTCWVGGFDRAAINHLFGLDKNLLPVAVIPVGYPDGKLPPQRPRISLEEVSVEPQVQPHDSKA